MKNLFILAAAIAGFFLIYLLGCFYSVSFNIANWSADARATVVLFGLVATALSSAAAAKIVYPSFPS